MGRGFLDCSRFLYLLASKDFHVCISLFSPSVTCCTDSLSISLSSLISFLSASLLLGSRSLRLVLASYLFFFRVTVSLIYFPSFSQPPYFYQLIYSSCRLRVETRSSPSPKESSSRLLFQLRFSRSPVERKKPKMIYLVSRGHVEQEQEDNIPTRRVNPASPIPLFFNSPLLPLPTALRPPRRPPRQRTMAPSQCYSPSEPAWDPSISPSS